MIPSIIKKPKSIPCLQLPVKNKQQLHFYYIT